MNEHLLLIEDNQEIAQNIVAYLESEGRTVDHISTGNEGVQTALEKHYDLIILDVMLPGLDGFSICREVRQKKKEIPIIMTTAKGHIDDKAIGFDEGADDYLVKPFSLAELVMRIRALLKRTETKDIYRRENIEVLLEENTVMKEGNEIHLTTKEWLILVYLIEQNGRVVTRTDLIDFVRGEDIRGNDAKLDVYIANLRKKLDKELIITVKGVGYKIG